MANNENIEFYRVDFERGWILIRWILIVYSINSITGDFQFRLTSGAQNFADASFNCELTDASTLITANLGPEGKKYHESVFKNFKSFRVFLFVNS